MAISLHVAFAVTGPDDEVVTHFGFATGFRIAELNEEGVSSWSFVAVRPFCGLPDRPADAIRNVVAVINGCEAVVTAAAGPCARAELTSAGITVLESEEAIESVAQNMVKRRAHRVLGSASRPTAVTATLPRN